MHDKKDNSIFYSINIKIKMKKKTFEQPQIKVVEIENTDIIASSDPIVTNDDMY